MKRKLIAIALMLSAVTAGAQTMRDGLTFSQNNYYGTARTIGMGNAMTAVGGDLGSIVFNPAGSAVYNYSQISITPSITVSSMNSSWSSYPVNGNDVFSNDQRKNLSRFSMPNFGASINMATGNRRGLVAVTYGLVLSGTDNYTGQMMTGGRNDKTSYLSWVAVSGDSFDIDFLNGYRDAKGKEIDDWKHPYYNLDDQGKNVPWNVIANAQSGAIANYGESDDPNYRYRYIAATEGYSNTGEKDQFGNHIYDIFLGGPLDQAYGRKVTGSKYDAIANVGFNFNNRFFVGVNLGITNLNYNFDEYFKEAAVNPSDFMIEYSDGTTYFTDYRARYSYTVDGSGAYGKVGFIALPVEGLRLGAAIQTPTVIRLDEAWRHATDVHYENSRYDGSSASPEGNFSYRLRIPYRVNAGVAYTFMGMALLSADYEMVDYSKMMFKENDSWRDTFTNLNNEIKDCMGVAHSVRLGAEFKPFPEFAVRAGYNYTTIPEYSYSGSAKTTLHDNINSYSVGLGYSSKGSFFADFAARMTTLSDEEILPYPDYLDNVASPMILNKRDRYDITATIGWRF